MRACAARRSHEAGHVRARPSAFLSPPLYHKTRPVLVMSGLCPLGGGRMIGEVHVSQLDMLTAAVKRLEDKAAAVVVPAPADKKQRGELHRLLKPAYPCARFRLHCSALDFSICHTAPRHQRAPRAGEVGFPLEALDSVI